MWKKKTIEEENVNVTINTLIIYTKLYHTYQLLYCEGQIQITSKHSTLDTEKENNTLKNVNVTISTLSIYTTLYNTYLLLHFKGHNSDKK